MALKRVVVTGLGAITPIGKSLPDYWQGLVDGKSGAAAITRFDASLFKTQFACEVKDYNAEDYFDRREARRLDMFSQFAMIATDEAIADANFGDNLDKERIGVIWSSGIGGQITFQEEVSKYAIAKHKDENATPRYNPFFIPKMIIDIASGNISIKHGFKGPNYSVVSACASSTNGLIDAANLIRLGYADAIVTGGSEAAITEAAIGGFNALKALSTRNDEPQTASRPFDVDRDGFVMGEGGAAIIVESYESAIKRGAKIYAEIVGIGLSGDAYHLTAPHPEGEGAAIVMKNALKDANMDASEMDHINVHGTSTPLGDVAELKAIEKVFGDHAYNLNVSATKSMTGHLLGAAGAVESIASILSIEHGIVPPTINHFNIDPEINSNFKLTFNKAEKRSINYVLSNTFGFGGHNASVIFKKIDV